jgi:hypothetical protein
MVFGSNPTHIAVGKMVCKNRKNALFYIYI